MSIPLPTLYTTLGALFATVLGCYIYVHKRCAHLQGLVRVLEVDTVRRMGRLETDLSGRIHALQLDMTDRLARLDTKVDILVDQRSSKKEAQREE